ncbi:uncharacterized protein BDV14DRAFT_205992 [Aspergillus stella-maris]|uniref:uncharacterized protein n=1 Tax=Aspergillus stella-maris TaxID=1810926 RepID=UPI003CCD992E
MTNGDPTFGGKLGEDVDLFLDQCRVRWFGRNLGGEDLALAIATTTLGGLRDAAERYARTLTKDERKDWNILHDKLREKFQEKEDPNRDILALRRVSRFAQDTGESTKAYLERARDLEVELPADPKWQGLLTGGVVDGLRNETSKKVLIAQMEARGADNPFRMDEITRVITSLEDGPPKTSIKQTEWMKASASEHKEAFEEVSKRISALERPAPQQRPEGQLRQPLEPIANRKCYPCGKYGHLASSCTEPAPAQDAPKPPQILARPASTPATSTTPGTTSMTVAANVELIDLGDGRLDNWSGMNAVQLTYSGGALDRAYALGEKRVHEEAFDTTS